MNMEEFIQCQMLYKNMDRMFKDILHNTPENILEELNISRRMTKLTLELRKKEDMPAYDVIKTMYDAVIEFGREIKHAKATHNMLEG